MENSKPTLVKWPEGVELQKVIPLNGIGFEIGSGADISLYPTENSTDVVVRIIGELNVEKNQQTEHTLLFSLKQLIAIGVLAEKFVLKYHPHILGK